MLLYRYVLKPKIEIHIFNRATLSGFNIKELTEKVHKYTETGTFLLINLRFSLA